MSEDFFGDGFPLRLEQRIDELGLTQIQVAERVRDKAGGKMGQPRVSAILKGTGKATLVEIERLARALDTTPEWLAFQRGEVAASPATRPEPGVVREGKPAGRPSKSREKPASGRKGA